MSALKAMATVVRTWGRGLEDGVLELYCRSTEVSVVPYYSSLYPSTLRRHRHLGTSCPADGGAGLYKVSTTVSANVLKIIGLVVGVDMFVSIPE